jgi:hypothetical protein
VTLQKRAIRDVYCAPFNAHAKYLFKKSNTLAFKELYVKEICLFAFKFLHNQLPAACKNYLHVKIALSSYNLRTDSLCLRVPVNHTVLRDKFIEYTASKHWNTLPNDIREQACISSFKKSCLTSYAHRILK